MELTLYVWHHNWSFRQDHRVYNISLIHIHNLDILEEKWSHFSRRSTMDLPFFAIGFENEKVLCTRVQSERYRKSVAWKRINRSTNESKYDNGLFIYQTLVWNNNDQTKQCQETNATWICIILGFLNKPMRSIRISVEIDRIPLMMEMESIHVERKRRVIERVRIDVRSTHSSRYIDIPLLKTIEYRF